MGKNIQKKIFFNSEYYFYSIKKVVFSLLKGSSLIKKNI